MKPTDLRDGLIGLSGDVLRRVPIFLMICFGMFVLLLIPVAYNVKWEIRDQCILLHPDGREISLLECIWRNASDHEPSR